MSESTSTRRGGVGPRPDQVRRLDLSASARPVGTARAFAHDALTSWRIGDPSREDVALVVCELVANAEMHVGGALGLNLLHTAGTVRVEVSDAGRLAPTPRAPSPGRPGGHGLIVVQRLCRRWGTDWLARGKQVWAEIATPANR